MPRFSEDDVLDYMVLEAVVIKARHEEEKAAKANERKDWKKDTSALEHLR